MTSLVLSYERPAARWLEALPIGNGRLGAMVFGGVGTERLQLNEDTFWSGPPGDWNVPSARAALSPIRAALREGHYVEADRLARLLQGPYTQSYLPLADLQISFPDATEVPREYARQLDLATALATTHFVQRGVLFEREALASAPDQAIVLHLRAPRGALRFTARVSSKVTHQVARERADALLLSGRGPVHAEPDYRDVSPAIVYREHSGVPFAVCLRVVTDGRTVATSDHAVVVENASQATLTVTARTGFTGFSGALLSEEATAAGAREDAAAASARAYETVKRDHIADHQNLFNRVVIDLGATEAAHAPTDERIRRFSPESDPHLITLLFQYGRYLLVASSRPGSQPANLQGIWNDELRPPWSSNFTLNINAQMNYWSAEPTHLAECHQPFLEFIEQLAARGRLTAAINYGCRGWVAHHNSDVWRHTGQVGGFGEGDAAWACWPMAAAWLSLHLWEHFAFGGDRGFLREHAYPTMKGAALFYLDWLIEDGAGKAVTAPGTSPENKFTTDDGQRAAVSIGPTMDLALIWDLFGNCIEAAAILGEDRALAIELERVRAALPLPAVGRHGQLQEWRSDWDDPNDRHRHVSHLFGLYPGRQITTADPELLHAARRALELRGDAGTGWSMAWKANLWARLGEGDRALRLITNTLTLVEADHVEMDGGGVYPNLFGAHPPFQIDGNLGVTAGIAEMLLQSHAGELQLLPALPSSWASGSVRGLCARGGFQVNLAWAEGRLARATITSLLGGPCRVRTSSRVIDLSTEAGRSYQVDGP